MSPVVLTIAKLLPASARATGASSGSSPSRAAFTPRRRASGVITVTDPYDVTTQMLGGLLQRIHLTATQRCLDLHHMNQITERIDRERATGATATFAPRSADCYPPAFTRSSRSVSDTPPVTPGAVRAGRFRR